MSKCHSECAKEFFSSLLELISAVAPYTAKHVIVLDPLSINIEEGGEERVRVRVDESQIFRIVTVIKGEPRPNCSLFIFSADRTIRV